VQILIGVDEDPDGRSEWINASSNGSNSSSSPGLVTTARMVELAAARQRPDSRVVAF
jgi:hypothetical protein